MPKRANVQIRTFVTKLEPRGSISLSVDTLCKVAEESGSSASYTYKLCTYVCLSKEVIYYPRHI